MGSYITVLCMCSCVDVWLCVCLVFRVWRLVWCQGSGIWLLYLSGVRGLVFGCCICLVSVLHLAFCMHEYKKQFSIQKIYKYNITQQSVIMNISTKMFIHIMQHRITYILVICFYLYVMYVYIHTHAHILMHMINVYICMSDSL